MEVTVEPMTPIDETPVGEDKDEIELEMPIKPFSRNRRSAKSRLGLISGNQGFHSVKLPLHRRQSRDADSVLNTQQTIDGENLNYVVRRRRLVSVSGKELWRSTKQRVEERKIDFDKRLSQVEKIARRYTIKHSQSVRRKAKEKAVFARRSTMAASASNEANRQEFITKRNGRFQDRGELFQKVIEESVDGGSGEEYKDEVRDVLKQEPEARKRQREIRSATGSSAEDVLQLHTVEKSFDHEATGIEIQEQGRSRGDEEGAGMGDPQQASGCEVQKDEQKSPKKVSIIELTESLDV